MSENITAPAFQFYAQDFLTGVMYLTNEEIGIYIKMLAKQWTDGKIPKKRLGFLVGIEWDSFSDELQDKFHDLGDYVINMRLEKEREKKANFHRKQSENGKKGGRPAKKNSEKLSNEGDYEILKENNPTLLSGLSQNKPKKSLLEDEVEIEEEIEKEVKKPNAGKNKSFQPPDPNEVQQYCTERQNNITGQEFCDFYSSKGWMVGKNKMKDWKASVRTWENSRKNGFTNNTKPSTGKISGHQFIAGKLRELSTRDSESGDNTIDIEAFEVK